METLSPAPGPMAQNEPIPGYVLKARLGSGGYGEVWEAEAPGGLRKALKFIYGRLDESRAQSELRSLNRIKEVRHPFLLSIERIEMVDGRLIIVTELAQGCLKTRFEQCRQAGMEGIGRQELLGYIRDAADALDFIHDRHGLQHLDIKPENLLIVGNHVKVADFGLLKDLGDSLSSVEGLTALYCPPETLTGRPSRHSDQYSLAIVYQEMLTDHFPFGGRTAAQLAAQHLHSPPILAALPPADQPIVARALSKNPEQRFPSCRAFASALGEMDDAVPSSIRRARAGRRPIPPPRSTKTEPVRGSNPVDPSSQAAASQTAAAVRSRGVEVRELPAIDLSAKKTRFRPTVLVGVGGTAGRILSHLQRRLRAAYGDPAAVPAVQTLLLDTDTRDLAAMIFKRGDGSLPANNTVAIPLRAPKDYRADSKRMLEWLSRRWLYNIPRSLQTEGLRPLGRLAFVDHSATIFERIRETILKAISPEALERSRETTKLEFSPEPPSVFVIASLAGGTGGGIAIDLGYAVRKVLQELGLPEERVYGLLTHSTSFKAASRDLAVVNTLAGLQELRHFGGRGGHYPGDPACDLPPFCENHATFHETYLVHLGNELVDRQFEAAADRMAEYLYQNTLTPAAAFFEEARNSPENGTRNETRENSLAADRVRTFGLALFDPPRGGEREETPAHVGDSLGDTPASPPAEQGPPAGLEQGSTVPSQAFQSCPTPDAGAGSEPAQDGTVGSAAVAAAGAVGIQTEGEDGEESTPRPPSLGDHCRGAVPELLACGGARRTLVLFPAEMSHDRLVESNDPIPRESLNLLEHSSKQIVVCQELADVPLSRVLKELVGSRRDYPELADRLHTRVDVDWPPLCLAGAD